jgi:hypothetical protein
MNIQICYLILVMCTCDMHVFYNILYVRRNNQHHTYIILKNQTSLYHRLFYFLALFAKDFHK